MRKKVLLLIAILSSIVYMNAENTTADKLINRLKKVEKQGEIIFGHHDDPVYGHSWVGDIGRSDIKDILGDYPGIMNWDLGGIELDHKANLDGVDFNRMKKEILAQYKRGGINTFSWHLHNPVTREDSWKVGPKDIVSASVTPGTVANDTLIAWVDKIANFINSLKDEKGDKIPVIFRPWHEHNGSWFWWGKDLCSVEDYKKLWKITRERFNENGVNNVVWAYSPNIVKDEADYTERYPGDEYADILGADVYQFNGEAGLKDYKNALNTALSIATKLAKEKNKLVAFTETGSESIPMQNWWTEVLLPEMSKYPIVYVTVWRNAHDNPKHFFAPYPGQKSEKSFIEFSKNKKILFTKGLFKIK